MSMHKFMTRKTLMRKSSNLLMGAMMAAVLMTGGCNRSAQVDDKEIVEGIQSKLHQDSNLKARDINVVAAKGVVVLSGQVNSEAEKAAAEKLAASEEGATHVVNQLAVSGAPVAAKPSTGATSGAESSKSPTKEEPAAPEGVKQAEPTPAPQPPPPPKPVVVTLSAGTVVSVQMIDSINSKTSQPGSLFAASLAAPLVSGEKVIFSQGSEAKVRLESAKQAGRMKGSSELQIELVSLTRSGQVYQVQSGLYEAKGDSRGKQTGKRMAGGALVGGVIGGIAGGGKGVAIGAGAGAGTAALVQASTKGKEVKVPAETKLDFKLASSLEVTL
jgi:hypothetical protein